MIVVFLSNGRIFYLFFLSIVYTRFSLYMRYLMEIYTSYYDNQKNIPENIHKIWIWWRVVPEYSGDRYPKLAPKRKFWKVWEEMEKKWNSNAKQYYIDNFKSMVLDCLSADNVVKDLEDKSEWRDVVLLCREKPWEFCHRHLVAEWLTANWFPCKEFDRDLYDALDWK